jgi:hypothetical protein
MSMLLILTFTCLAVFGLGEFRLSHSNTRVRLELSSPNACLIVARVFVALSRDLYKISCTLAVGSIVKSHQAMYKNKNEIA